MQDGSPIQAEEHKRLIAENALFRIAIEELPLGLSMFDQNDRLVLANKQYGEIWGLPAESIKVGATFGDIIKATAGVETPESKALPLLPKGIAGVRRREWLMDDGRSINIVITRMIDGSCIALHEDITEKKFAETQIAFLAHHDQLTGLPNRRIMGEEMTRLLARKQRGQEEILAILCLDLDRFKAVNDTFGHAAGDELLRQVAARLKRSTRETDLVVRFGGDEFAILQIGQPQPASSTALASRLVLELAEPFNLAGQIALIGTSIGIALAPHNGKTIDALLNNADLALYRAKEAGRGTYRYFESAMDERIQAKRALEHDLRKAIELGELYLAYQPSVNIETGEVTAFEALLRWQHPTKGNISPADFIPIAEESGLILQIGQWVLKEACLVAATLPAHILIAVNVSVVQLMHDTILNDVVLALENANIKPQQLVVEITESVMMQDPKRSMLQLKVLSALGIQLAIDDFGTGYSSLSYLHGYPCNRIKIDRSFVCDIETSTEAQTVIRAIITLGYNLGLDVTIEGVETERQLEQVRKEGAREVQGFYFSKPIPASKIYETIKQLKSFVTK